MKKKFVYAFVACCMLPSAYSLEAGAQTYEYPFQNPKLSYEERVENLISLLTPEEKVGLMMNKSASIFFSQPSAI